MATKPDVRIRLSAEGVQEVVSALKSVQSQAGRTKTDVEKSAGGFNKAAKGVATLSASVKALAGLAVVVKTISFAIDFAKASGDMKDFAQASGMAVDEFSRLDYAAKLSGVSTQTIASAMSDFAKNVDKAAKGTGEQAAAFKRLGIEIKGKTQRQILDEIADKFELYADGAGKSAIAAQLFGGAGKDLIPILNGGAKSLKDAGDEADRFGVTVLPSAADEAERFNTNLARMQTAAGSLARELLTNLIPRLTGVMERFLEAKNSGEGFLGMLDAAVYGVGYGSDLAQLFEEEKELIAKIAKQREKLEDPFLKGIRVATFSDGLAQAELDRLEKSLALVDTKIKAGLKDAIIPTAAPAKGQLSLPDPGEFSAEALALAKAKAAASKAIGDSALATQKASNALTEAEESRHFSTAQQSLDTYNVGRISRIKSEIEAERALALRQLADANGLADSSDAEKAVKAKALVEAQGKLDRLEIDSKKRLLDATAEYEDKLKSLNQEQETYSQRQLELTGRVREASLMAMETELTKLDELMKKRGVSNEIRERELKLARELGTARIDFAENQLKGTSEFSSLDRAKSDIERQRDTGKLWNAQADAQLLELEKARIPVLEEIAEKMRAAAEASKDTTLVDQALAFSDAVENMKAATDEYGKAMAMLRGTAENAVVGGIGNVFDSIIDGSKSAKEAVRSFAFDVVDQIRRIAQELLLQQAIKSFFGSFGGGAGGSGGGLRSILGFAGGGHVRGPGSGTSDDIPAWLSNGEFVVRESVVKQPGMLDMLRSLNSGINLAPVTSGFRNAPAFADGGLAGTITQAHDAGSASRIDVGLEPGLVLRELNSRAGQVAVVQALGKNRKAARQMGI